MADDRARLIRTKGLLVEPGRGLVEFAFPGMGEWLRNHPNEATTMKVRP